MRTGGGGICRQDGQMEGWDHGANSRGGRGHEEADGSLQYSSGPTSGWVGRGAAWAWRLSPVDSGKRNRLGERYLGSCQGEDQEKASWKPQGQWTRKPADA